MSMIRCGLFGVFNVDYTRTIFSSKPKMDVLEDSLSIFNLEFVLHLVSCVFFWGENGKWSPKEKVPIHFKKNSCLCLDSTTVINGKSTICRCFLFLSEKRNVHCNVNLTSQSIPNMLETQWQQVLFQPTMEGLIYSLGIIEPEKGIN